MDTQTEKRVEKMTHKQSNEMQWQSKQRHSQYIPYISLEYSIFLHFIWVDILALRIKKNTQRKIEKNSVSLMHMYKQANTQTQNCWTEEENKTEKSLQNKKK